MPCTDLTKTAKKPSEISMLTALVADILLVTTARPSAGEWYAYKIESENCGYYTIAGNGRGH